LRFQKKNLGFFNIIDKNVNFTKFCRFFNNILAAAAAAAMDNFFYVKITNSARKILHLLSF
jgi:hypothetical protein